MKKIIMMLVAGAMACGLAACSDDDTTPSGNITPCLLYTSDAADD